MALSFAPEPSASPCARTSEAVVGEQIACNLSGGPTECALELAGQMSLVSETDIDGRRCNTLTKTNQTRRPSQSQLTQIGIRSQTGNLLKQSNEMPTAAPHPVRKLRPTDLGIN